MIPQIIHYCWFGRNPLPESAQKCIASWRKFLPNYEIKEWNEDNFDVNIIPYTQQAYEAKKYAFVSDYARFWILYRYGGLYFDTDVEVIKPFDDIIERGPFMGIEVSGKNGSMPQVAPGLGLGAEPNMAFYKEALEAYSHLSFLNEDGTLNQKTIVAYNTELLIKNGMLPTNEQQQVAKIWIYPSDYFNPFDELTGRLHITENTRSIHWYSNSWSDSSRFRQWLSRMSHRVFGLRLHNWMERLRKVE
jgi:mannosyltransferase OCH1-like enzyme